MNEECSVDVLKLDHDPPEDFGLCVCQSATSESYLYVIIRDLFCVYHFSMLIWAIVLGALEKNLKLFIFFDFWVQALLFISSEFGIYGPAWSYKAAADYDDGCWDYLPWYCRVYWALFSAALPSTILSSIVFWIQMFRSKVHLIHAVLNCASPSVLCLEFVMVSFPVRLLNFFYFVIFYIIYIGFTAGYQKNGGTGVLGSVPIYKALDWNKPGKAVLAAFVGLAIGLIAYFLFCFLSMMKLAWRNRSFYN